MTATIDILNQAQIDELRGMFDARKGQDQTIEGLWSPVYEKLYSLITDNYDLNEPSTEQPKVGIDKQTWLWLRGARFINANSGPFAALIRNYTIIQHRLRYSIPATQAEMDQASNKIAMNFLGQWLGYDLTDFDATPGAGTQPDITDAGRADAGPAAAGVFNKLGDIADPAGWAGTLLFGNLGDSDPWRGLILASLQDPSVHGHVQQKPRAHCVGSSGLSAPLSCKAGAQMAQTVDKSARVRSAKAAPPQPSRPKTPFLAPNSCTFALGPRLRRFLARRVYLCG